MYSQNSKATEFVAAESGDDRDIGLDIARAAAAARRAIGGERVDEFDQSAIGHVAHVYREAADLLQYAISRGSSGNLGGIHAYNAVELAFEAISRNVSPPVDDSVMSDVLRTHAEELTNFAMHPTAMSAQNVIVLLEQMFESLADALGTYGDVVVQESEGR